nr:hypothetical protein [Tanacetum cinerariifolium]
QRDVRRREAVPNGKPPCPILCVERADRQELVHEGDDGESPGRAGSTAGGGPRRPGRARPRRNQGGAAW